MTSKRAPTIVSASPGLPASLDHCPADLAPRNPDVSLADERGNIAREEAFRTANYFKSLRKVGTDALLYQATE